jgi:hypothetical protein
VFSAFATGCLFALVLAALGPVSLDSSSLPFLRMSAGAALVVAALQNITAPDFPWVRRVAAVFGVFDGLLLGAAFRETVPFAGTHVTVSIVAYAATILVGSLWLLLVAHPAVGLVYRSRLPERWAIVCLSAIPIHAGLHSLLVGQ